MSIKSDRWIRRMSKEQGMIEPFSEQQVRVANGHRIVSYGTSSYGYDVRCAEDFKIFTNINSTIVDPKAFDEKSFVDFRGPVCIIPPNSFALASTVEYFRIPRSVLTVCLGKCVTGDTRVVDAETGAYMPITEMRFGKSTLALDNWKLKPAKVSAFVPQGRKEVFELRTRAGLRIRATANHPFLKFVGWTALRELKAGDRIAAARAVPVFGKTPIPDSEASRLGKMIADGEGDALVPQAIFTAPENSVRLFLQSLLLGQSERVPQLDGFRNNTSVRAGGLTAVDLLQVDPQPDQYALSKYSFSSRRLAEDIHHLLLRFGIFSTIGEKSIPDGASCCTIQLSKVDRINLFAEGSRASAGSRVVAMSDAPAWDVVEQIESVGEEEVFDISVPNLHNFLANDLIVHNSTYARCGIIVNVTPLEPEWEGHVTLEFSNTTPLPAKIYANEGVAQMLFFESDEVCETSYKDRGGKYQGQRGVTLPKT